MDVHVTRNSPRANLIRSLKKDLVVIFLSFKVLDVKWGCAVHPY
jgi:hypothetical protein